LSFLGCEKALVFLKFDDSGGDDAMLVLKLGQEVDVRVDGGGSQQVLGPAVEYA
jgi:hypothetical protein